MLMYIASNGIKTAVIEYDPDPQNPRDPMYQDNLGTMTCWHSRYNLGDEHSFRSPKDFLADLAERHVSTTEFLRFVQDGGANDLRLDDIRGHNASWIPADASYELQYDFGTPSAAEWMPTGCYVSEDLRLVGDDSALYKQIFENMDRSELEDLLETSEDVIVMPLYLYDHSGLSISTGSFIGRALHAEWDSGQVGYIHMTKKQAMDELAMRDGEGKLVPLTDKTWRKRAEGYLNAEVDECDSYLRGEVYGYRTFEGLDEADSCWGFNPGGGDIEKLMTEELGSWYGPDLEFEYSYESDFDIEKYFETHDFPELRERISSEVLESLSAIEKDSSPYPFELSAEAIRGDEGGVLSDIVSEIYDEHVEPTPERIREALDDHAGISREVKPKLTAADLDPDRDYTVEELCDLAREKTAKRAALAGAEQAFGHLADTIARKTARQDGPER